MTVTRIVMFVAVGLGWATVAVACWLLWQDLKQ